MNKVWHLQHSYCLRMLCSSSPWTCRNTLAIALHQEMLALIQYIEGVKHLKCSHEHQSFRTIATIRAFPWHHELLMNWFVKDPSYTHTGVRVTGTMEYFSHLVLFTLRLAQGVQIRVTWETFFLKGANLINY